MIAAGEGYGTGHINEPEEIKDENLVNPFLAMVPLFTVLVLNFILTNSIKGWDPNILKPYGITLASVTAIWALIIALVVGIIVAIIIGWKNVKSEVKIMKALNAGAIGSLLAIMNTSSEVGYGNVVSSLPGFKTVANALMSIDIGTPLLSESISVNVLAGITGSASGGMSIALETMGKQYLDWANAIGLNPELLHRVASLSSGGFDTMPHNGAVITLLAITGMNHRASYPDIGMVSLVIPFASTIILILLSTILGLG
jgi:H+/gluconate symporter-like permease